jgi:hypothetical protein
LPRIFIGVPTPAQLTRTRGVPRSDAIGCHRRLAGLSIRDIDCKRPSADALRYGVRSIGIEIEHGDLGAACRELDGGRLAEPRSAAGDDRYLVLEVHEFRSLIVPGSHPGA